MSRSIVARAAALLAVAVLAACPDPPPPPAVVPDDAGDLSWARQVIPILYGRKPKGCEEARLLADLVALADRPTVLRALMHQEEFVPRWTAVFADRMRVDRQGDKLPRGCYDRPLRQAVDPTLAETILATDPGTAINAPPFNIVDVAQSAVAIDNLSPLYRAHLFVLQAFTLGRSEPEQRRRDDLGGVFEEVYLGRQLACLPCHNGDSSVTGAASGWERSFPIAGSFEEALYGSSTGSDPATAHGVFNTAVSSFQGQPPWGMAAECGLFSPGIAGSGENAAFGGLLGDAASIYDLEAKLHAGYDALADHGVDRSNGVVPANEAFAFLVATAITNATWDEVMGAPLTIANYFPRTEEQRAMLWHLAEDVFVRSGWSLRELLVSILSANTFNRHAPAQSPGATAYSLPVLFDPWVLRDPRQPPVTDPGYDPAADAEHHHNAAGDGVYRYGAWTLVQSLSRALGWPGPYRLVPGDTRIGRLQVASGQYLSAAHPGTRTSEFSAFLAWEREVGACASPEGTEDWVDDVVASARAFLPGPGGNREGLSLADLVRVEEDWLLAEDTFPEVPAGSPGADNAAAEREILAGLVAPLHLDDAVAQISDEDLEGALRKTCAVMIASPQFQLAGLASEASCPAPRLRVCRDSPCTYREMCEALKPYFTWPQGTTLVCGTDRVQLVDAGPEKPPSPIELCPAGWCGDLPLDPRHACWTDRVPCRIEPPGCDPRCTGPTCCGDPPPYDGSGLLVAWADGAVVREAEGGVVIREGAAGPLRAGTTLREGDLVRLAPQGVLDARLAPGASGADGTRSNSEVRFAWDGRKTSASGRPLLMVVSGPSALASRARSVQRAPTAANQADVRPRPGAANAAPDPRAVDPRRGGAGREEAEARARLEAWRAAREKAAGNQASGGDGGI